ncbi:molybdopterin biosynthesis protein MoeA, partial [mine drainage metagenome]
AAGTLLKPQHLALLAGMGEAEIKVRERPRVALITTGAELVDDLSRPLEPGQIYNTNAILLAQRLCAAGAELVMQATVPDQSDTYILAVHHALDLGARVIVSTGAVSMGRYDFVPAALAALGAEIVFHKVRMRPGKPLLFAQLLDGALLFGLPGNPTAGAVGERFFVEASLRRMLGMATEQPWRLPLLDVACKPGGFLYFQKARLVVAGDSVVRVAILHGQESFRIRTLSESTVWAVLPEEEAELPADTRVDVYPLGHVESDLMGDIALCAST